MSKRIVSIGKPAVSTPKIASPQPANVFCGIDVSAETRAVAVIEPDQAVQQREFAGCPILRFFLAKGGRPRTSAQPLSL